MLLLEMKMDKPPRVYDFFLPGFLFSEYSTYKVMAIQQKPISYSFFFLVIIILTYCSVFSAESDKTLFPYFN